MSLSMLGIGSVSLSAILLCTPGLINEEKFNSMEFAQISSLIVCIVATAILFSFTKKRPSSAREASIAADEESAIDQSINGNTPEDIKV